MALMLLWALVQIATVKTVQGVLRSDIRLTHGPVTDRLVGQTLRTRVVLKLVQYCGKFESAAAPIRG